MRRLLFAFACLSSMLMSAQNLWHDPSFEEAGESIPNAHSGQKALVLTGGASKGWFPSPHISLQVEPYALYKATAWVKRDKNAGSDVFALFFYSWDSFGWSFMYNCRIPEGDEWIKVSTTFYTPKNIMDFHPLAFNKCVQGARLYMDDLEIVRIKSPEEHIEHLKKQSLMDRNVADAMARYYLEKKDYAALEEMKGKVNDWNKADISCLLAKDPAKKADAPKNIANMIRFDGLSSPEGHKRLREFFDLMTFDQATAICLDAIPNGVPVSVQKAFDVLLGNAYYLDGKVRLRKKAATYEKVIATLEATKNPAYSKYIEKLKNSIPKELPKFGNRNVVLGNYQLNAKNYAIVLPKEPTVTESHAASELQGFLEDMTGEELPKVLETDALPPHVIIIGRNASLAKYGFSVDYDRLGLEGTHIALRDGNLLLAGGQRGVLYAVYSFLEDYLECHWFTEDCSVIPNHGSAKLNDFDNVFLPALEYRDTDYPCCRAPEFGVRNKLNGLYSKASKVWGEHNTYGGFVHTMTGLLLPSKYGNTHPEYYAERNGKRMIEHSQPCLTNPDVLRIVTENLLKRIADHPEHTLFSVSQNDNQNYCQCKNCTALAEKEGSQMGPLLHFVNAIAREVAKKYPDKIIDTLAYQYTRKPPKYVKPEPNVCIRLCSIECCFSHSIEDDEVNSSFINDIRGWQKICNRLHIWDYVINYAHTVCPFPNFRVLKPNIQFFLANGAKGIYEEANYFSKGGEFSELRSYVMAKLLWDATYDVDRAIYDFTEAYYGPAGKYIRQYIKLLHDNVCSQKDVHMRIFVPPQLYLSGDGLLLECEEIFKKAEAAVADSPVLTHRVNVAHLPVIYASQTIGTQKYARKGNILSRKSANEAALKMFASVAAKEGITHLRESKNHEIQAWIDGRLSAPSEIEIVSIASDKTRLDILPSLGGRVWKAVDLATGEDILQYVGNDKDGYVPDMSAYEEYSTGDYHSEGWVSKFAVVEKGDGFIVLRAQMSGGLIATRRIELLKGQSGFKVDTQYTANKNMPARVCRVHPQFHVENPRQAKVFLKLNDGSFEMLDLQKIYGIHEYSELWYRDNMRPNGEWRVEYPCKHGTAVLSNQFDTSMIKDCYIHCSEADQHINLEQWTFPVPVTKNSGPRLTNTYVFKIKE